MESNLLNNSIKIGDKYYDVNLQELDLSKKRLTILPKEISNLINLQILNLSYNQLTNLKKICNLINLINLQELDLFENQLRSYLKKSVI